MPGETIALIGGDILLEGGIVRANDARVEIAASRSGTVGFANGLAVFNYDEVVEGGNVRLSQASIVDVRGVLGGAASLTGAEISLLDGSIVDASSLTNGSPGARPITVDAESLTVGGTLSGVPPTDSIVSFSFPLCIAIR